MTTEKEDRRIVKTRRNIERTFLDLLKNMSFAEITVQKLADAALISKGTFYAHYRDKYDLAEKMITATLAEFRHGIRERIDGLLTGGKEDVLLTSLAGTLKITLPQLSLLKKIKTDTIDIEASIRLIMEEEYFYLLKKQGITPERPELRAHIISTLMLGFVAWQENHPDEYSPIDYLKEVSNISEEYLRLL